MAEKFDVLARRKIKEIWDDYREETKAAWVKRNERLNKVRALREIGEAMDKMVACLDIVCPPGGGIDE